MLKSRRKFIQATALATSHLVLSKEFSYGYHHSVDDTIKVALVGCGGRGTGAVAQALSTSQRVKLVAMADVFGDRLDASLKSLTSKQYKIPGTNKVVDVQSKVDVPEERRFVGFDAYKRAINLADVVILATPPGFRPSHFEEAVRRNKHVFMEKPIATDAPGVRKVLAAAEEAKRKKLNVVAGFQRHYQKNYIEAIKRIHEGLIGDIVGGQVYWLGIAGAPVARTPQMTEMEYQLRNKYYFTWLSGDHIVEQHVHNIDVANWVKNAYPVEVQGTGGRQTRTGKEYGEIFDHHLCDLVYADGTVISSQCRHYLGTYSRIDEGFVGTKGRIDSFGISTKLKNYAGKVLFSHDSRSDPNPYQVEHDVLFEAVASGEYKFSDAENAAKSTLTAIMGRMATYSGKVVRWEDALNSEISLLPERLEWDAMPKILPGQDGFYPVAVPGKTRSV